MCRCKVLDRVWGMCSNQYRNRRLQDGKRVSLCIENFMVGKSKNIELGVGYIGSGGNLTPQMHISRSNTPSNGTSIDNERIALRPTNGNSTQQAPISDLRHPSPLPRSSTTTSPTRQPEQTNTKKKRASLANQIDLNDVQDRELTTEGEDESPRSPRTFGDPLKIAQYFPELT